LVAGGFLDDLGLRGNRVSKIIWVVLMDRLTAVRIQLVGVGHGRIVARLSLVALLTAALVPGLFAPSAWSATTGWAGETIVGADNTWEPHVAADPGAPYVYVAYNDFSGARACSRCPSPFMVVRTSSDGGATFGPQVRLCQCSGIKFQYDPVLTVTSTGTVYAVWMNTYTIVFSKSSNQEQPGRHHSQSRAR
jgi:hypothetical protein